MTKRKLKDKELEDISGGAPSIVPDPSGGPGGGGGGGGGQGVIVPDPPSGGSPGVETDDPISGDISGDEGGSGSFGQS